ncbi:hypothetical protein BH11BAC7_BH11BAC7_16010 [soil metagenome]
MKKIYTILKIKAAVIALFLLGTTTVFAQTDVLVCGAVAQQSWLDDVRNKLISTGSFSTVTSYNTYLTGTPTLAYLQGFDAVLVFTDNACLDPTTFGNNLAAYIDGGGGVVNCVFANASVIIGGNYDTPAYQVIVPTNSQNSSPTLTLGTILNPCHPIVQGVTSFSGGSSSYRSASNILAPGAAFVANWSNGEWLIAEKLNVGPMNVRRADLNFYPPSSDVRSDFWSSSTQGARLMARSLLWVAGVINNGPPPAAPASILFGSGSLCQGSISGFFIASVYQASSYTWTVPVGSTIQSGQGTQNISVLNGPTSGTITVTANNGCGSSAPTSYTFTINPLPAVVANTTSNVVCSGSPVTLSGSGASTYTWTGSVSDNVAFTPASTNNYTVTGTDANGCQNSSSITITVNALPVVVANSTATTVCTGDQITLSGSGSPATYSWSNSVSDNVPFTVTTSDNYTVTGTDANGCTNTNTISVTVNGLPSVVANSNGSTVCMGSPATLFGSGASTYTWTGSVTNNTPFIPSATNTYTVTGTDANGCMNTDMLTVTVNALPPVVANSSASTICPGQTVTLFGSGAVTYTWTAPSPNNTPFVPVATATYTVTGTGANGCTNTDFLTVTVLPLPNITANSSASTVCQGAMVTLSGGGGVSYTWTGSVTDMVPFAATVTGTYTVTGVDASGCVNNDSITVNVNPGPTVTGTSTSTVMCLDDANATLTGSPVSGTWSGTGVSGTSFDPTTAGVGPEVVTYSFTNVNGCTGTASVTINVNACVGVAENALENSVSVYPNPNNGTFTISINANLGDVQIEMLDIQGRIIYTSHESNVAAGFTNAVSLDGMSNGIYMLRLTSGDTQQMIKVSVQK